MVFASPAPRAYFLPSALLAFVRKQGIGLKGQGHLPSAKSPEMSLCAHCSHLPPLSGPGVAVQAQEGSRASSSFPSALTLASPTAGPSQKLAPTFLSTLS